jgi:hypothetical protein
MLSLLVGVSLLPLRCLFRSPSRRFGHLNGRPVRFCTIFASPSPRISSTSSLRIAGANPSSWQKMPSYVNN